MSNSAAAPRPYGCAGGRSVVWGTAGETRARFLACRSLRELSCLWEAVLQHSPDSPILAARLSPKIGYGGTERTGESCAIDPHLRNQGTGGAGLIKEGSRTRLAQKLPWLCSPVGETGWAAEGRGGDPKSTHGCRALGARECPPASGRAAQAAIVWPWQPAAIPANLICGKLIALTWDRKSRGELEQGLLEDLILHNFYSVKCKKNKIQQIPPRFCLWWLLNSGEGFMWDRDAKGNSAPEQEATFSAVWVVSEGGRGFLASNAALPCRPVRCGDVGLQPPMEALRVMLHLK